MAEGGGRAALLPAPIRRKRPACDQGQAWRVAALRSLKCSRPNPETPPAAVTTEVPTPQLEPEDVPQEANFASVLRELAEEEDKKLVCLLWEQRVGLEQFLRGRPCPASTRLLLRLLARVCGCETPWPERRAGLLATAAQPELLDRLAPLLLEAAPAASLAADLLQLLTHLARLLPLRVAGLRATALGCLSVLGSAQGVPQGVVDRLERFVADVDAQKPADLKKSYVNPGLAKRLQEIEKMKYAEAPDDFRQLALLPTTEDVLSPHPPFLRPNVVSGPYLSVHHYLDTQFRLLREDFVRPLRQGVRGVVLGSNADRRCESLSVRVYRGVRFLRSLRETDPSGKVLNEGVLVALDPRGSNRRLRNTDWQHSKRFLFGGLLCFSSDHFESILFATVSSRDQRFLRNCQILVKFSQDYEENIFDPHKTFTMIESEVFFEPYYQVMKCLQGFTEETFPMAWYLVQMRQENAPPQYLLDGPAEIIVEGLEGRQHQLRVLQKDSWPSARQLGLDESQLRALQAALSQELALVQGPPGTGKTFMALLIAKILLRNKLGRSTPILVVCLTNHALDQFLLQLLQVTDKLVRIGGQSRSEQLDRFNLRRLEREKAFSKPGPEEGKLRFQLRGLVAKLAEIDLKLETVDKVIQEGIQVWSKGFGFAANLKNQRNEISRNIEVALKKIDELKIIRQIRFLKSRDVVGLTTTGAARLHTMLEKLGSEVVIVEEAAEVMESHVVACLSRRCQHLILIGDHKQLRPSISEYELGKLYNFDVSLFERLVMNRASSCVTLQVQHRMCPELAELIVPSIYERLDNHASVLRRPPLQSLTKRLFFKTHNEPEKQDSENSSRTNEFEADYLVALCKHLLNQEYKPSQISILATYKGQMFLIKRKIEEDGGERLKGVLVTVVDNYQGEENEIVLLSLVRSNPDGKIGFLATENRVCVALSRARCGFVIVGNMDQLAASNPLWQAVKKVLERQEAIGPALRLRCEVHPEQTLDFALPSDLAPWAPLGGCTQKCEADLECGHSCPSVCHLMVQPHSEIRCREPCRRLCPAHLHKCRLRCYEKCHSICREKVLKTLPCGHEATAECHQDPSGIRCLVTLAKTFRLCGHSANVSCFINSCPRPCGNQAPCGHSCGLRCHLDKDPDHLKYECRKQCQKLIKVCSGGHKCQKKCHEECTPRCQLEVEKRLSCGHKVTLLCSENPDEFLCNENCKRALACGHFCKRRCFEPCDPCPESVRRTVPGCGHSAEVPCGRAAGPQDCTAKCEKRLACGHRCRARCGAACTELCLFVTNWVRAPCGHGVERLCHQPDTTPMICTKIPECGHQCWGSKHCAQCEEAKLYDAIRLVSSWRGERPGDRHRRIDPNSSGPHSKQMRFF